MIPWNSVKASTDASTISTLLHSIHDPLNIVQKTSLTNESMNLCAGIRMHWSSSELKTKWTSARPSFKYNFSQRDGKVWHEKSSFNLSCIVHSIFGSFGSGRLIFRQPISTVGWRMKGDFLLKIKFGNFRFFVMCWNSRESRSLCLKFCIPKFTYL